MTVASEQKATTRVPSTVPTAASMPESSSGVISSRVPSSRSAVSRCTGLRGSSSRGSLACPAWHVLVRSTAVIRRDPKATATLAPPKPKELLSAAMSPAGRSRALVAMSSSTCGSRSSRLIVGGAIRWCSARTVAIDSRAPAPPSRWPVIDLVLVTTTSVGVRAERRVEHQPLGDVALRGRGRVGVDVDDVAGVDLAPRQGPQDRPGAAAAGRVGLGDVVGVGGDAGAEHLGVDPRAAGPGVLLGLEHQHAGALAEHEAVAGGVPGAGDRGRVAGRVRSWTAPSCWRTPPSAAGGSPPRCRRRRRRRRGRGGSGRGRGRCPRCRRRRPRPAC